jgi:hypothetical protein
MKLSDVLWVLMGRVDLYDGENIEDNLKLLGRYDLDLEFEFSYDKCLEEYGEWLVTEMFAKDEVINILLLEPQKEDEN